MKYFIILFLGVFLTSCFGASQDLEQAKQDLLSGNTSSQEDVQDANSNIQELQDSKQIEDTQYSIIAPLSADQFLEFNSISQDFITLGEVEISGKANVTVDSIRVEFSNPTSQYPDDNYVLQTYKPEEGVFTYRASSRNQVLDYGENNYIFTAVSGDKISQTKVTLIVPDDSQSPAEETGVEIDLLGDEDNLLQIEFPTSSKYGEPVKLGESSFTYSGIKGFEAEKKILQAPTCETLTDYLTQSINTWYYWNTCRDIVKDFGIKFNVIRLDGDAYIYEKHYIDFKHGIYATYELEKGIGVTPDTISEKNEELKERDFPSLEIVDDLMKDIVNS